MLKEENPLSPFYLKTKQIKNSDLDMEISSEISCSTNNTPKLLPVEYSEIIDDNYEEDNKKHLKSDIISYKKPSSLSTFTLEEDYDEEECFVDSNLILSKLRKSK